MAASGSFSISTSYTGGTPIPNTAATIYDSGSQILSVQYGAAGAGVTAMNCPYSHTNTALASGATDTITLSALVSPSGTLAPQRLLELTLVNLGATALQLAPGATHPFVGCLAGAILVPAGGAASLPLGAGVTFTAGVNDQLDVKIPTIAAPAAPAPTTAATGGTIAANTYYVVITHVNAAGETIASSQGSVTTTGSTSTITVPAPTAPGLATGWKAYGGTTNGSAWVLQGGVNAVNTALTLTAPLATGSAAPPGANTTNAGSGSYAVHIRANTT